MMNCKQSTDEHVIYDELQECVTYWLESRTNITSHTVAVLTQDNDE